MVGGGVVQDGMHAKLLGNLLVEQVEEAAEHVVSVSRGQVGDHMAGDHIASSGGHPIKRRIEAGGAVTHVALGQAAGSAGQHRLYRLYRRGVIEGLELSLFVSAEYDHRVGRA